MGWLRFEDIMLRFLLGKSVLVLGVSGYEKSQCLWLPFSLWHQSYEFLNQEQELSLTPCQSPESWDSAGRARHADAYPGIDKQNEER